MTRPTMREIATRVAEANGLTLAQMMQRRRLTHIAYPRQDAMREIRDALGASYSQIGDLFGMNHSTVLYGIEQSRARSMTRAEYRKLFVEMWRRGDTVEHIRNRLNLSDRRAVTRLRDVYGLAPRAAWGVAA